MCKRVRLLGLLTLAQTAAYAATTDFVVADGAAGQQ